MRLARQLLSCGVKVFDGKRMVGGRGEIDVQKSREHDERPRERVNEEFERDFAAIFTAPIEANEVNRNQREFPKNVKQEAVGSREHADKGGLHQKNKAVKTTRIVAFRRRRDD